MFDIYNVYADDVNYKGYVGKIYLGKIIVKNEEDALDIAKDVYKNIPEKGLSCEYVGTLKPELEYESKYNDEFFLNMEQSIDLDWSFDYSSISFALFHGKYRFPNNVDFTTEDFENFEEMKSYIEKEYEPVAIIPVSAYIHSGIALSEGTKNGWDSGQLGFMYISKEQSEYDHIPKNEEDVYKYLREHLKTIDHYVRGEVYVCSIYDIRNKPGKETFLVETIGDFVGDDFENNGLYDTVKDMFPDFNKETLEDCN
jgi:hypothetical protein